MYNVYVYVFMYVYVFVTAVTTLVAHHHSRYTSYQNQLHLFSLSGLEIGSNSSQYFDAWENLDT